MKPSQSDDLSLRGLRYHVRTWGAPHRPLIVMLHGFQDVSASWQWTVDALQSEWFVVAPDWRGYGLSARSGADAYAFIDFLGDLDALLDHYSPEQPVNLVGHSMGAAVGALYAGVRPDRVARFVNVDGFGPPSMRQDPTPRRLAKWLAQLKDDSRQRPYADYDEFALRMQSENPRLTPERARFIVEHWGEPDPEGGVQRRADPAHKRINPQPLSAEDIVACWQQTQAAVLWVDGAQSGLWARLTADPPEFERRAMAYQDLRIEHVADAGHNVHHDQPEALAALIEDFFRR